MYVCMYVCNVGKLRRNAIILLNSAFFRVFSICVCLGFVDEVNIGEVALGFVCDCEKYQQLFLLVTVYF